MQKRNVSTLNGTYGNNAICTKERDSFDKSYNYEDLVDIRTVKLREGASRLENALYFLEQIKTPHVFRVGSDVVEIYFAGEESLSDVLVKHFKRKK